MTEDDLTPEQEQLRNQRITLMKAFAAELVPILEKYSHESIGICFILQDAHIMGGSIIGGNECPVCSYMKMGVTIIENNVKHAYETHKPEPGDSVPVGMPGRKM